MVERQHFSKSENFNEAQAKFPHLRAYVNSVSEKLGVPQFEAQLNRDMRSLENPNIIYPVGDPIFIHLYKEDSAVVYHVIMPELDEEFRDIAELFCSKFNKTFEGINAEIVN